MVDGDEPAFAVVPIGAEREVVHAVMALAELLRLVPCRVGGLHPEDRRTAVDRVAPLHERLTDISLGECNGVRSSGWDCVEAEDLGRSDTVGVNRRGGLRCAAAERIPHEECCHANGTTAKNRTPVEASRKHVGERTVLRGVGWDVFSLVIHHGSSLSPLSNLEFSTTGTFFSRQVNTQYCHPSHPPSAATPT